jgi:hypothetical protein
MDNSALIEECKGGASPRMAQRQRCLSDARITLGTCAHVVEDSHREAVEKLAPKFVPIVPILELKSKWTQ